MCRKVIGQVKELNHPEDLIFCAQIGVFEPNVLNIVTVITEFEGHFFGLKSFVNCNRPTHNS